MRTGGRADDVERVVDVGDPVAQRLVHRVLERARARFDRAHFGAEQLHAEDVRLLALDIDFAHIDDAGKTEARGDRGRRDAVLARAGLGDDAGLAHAAREQNLAEAVVDLVRAGVIEVFALEIDLRAAEMFASGVRRNRADFRVRHNVSADRRVRPGMTDRAWPRHRPSPAPAPAASTSRRRSVRHRRRNGRAGRDRCERNWAYVMSVPLSRTARCAHSRRIGKSALHFFVRATSPRRTTRRRRALRCCGSRARRCRD